MQKKLITLAVAAALAAPLAAQADATMYGRMNMSYDIIDTDLPGGANVGAADIASDSSKIGVKGSEDLGNGLKAIYQMEWTVNLADQVNEFSSATAFGGRNTFVGLTGDWGTAIIGRHDTPMKISTGKLDYFADSIGDYDSGHDLYAQAGLLGVQTNGGFVDRRADATVAYISPNWNGLTLAGALVPGANNQADGVADAYSFAAMYGNSGFYGSLAYEGGDQDIDALGGAGGLAPGVIGDLNQWRIGLGYEAENFKVGAVYEDVQIDLQTPLIGDARDSQNWMINGAYMFGNATIKAAYSNYEEDVNNTSRDVWALGLDYALSKRTDVGVTYVNSDKDSNVVAARGETNAFSAGISHKF